MKKNRVYAGLLSLLILGTFDACRKEKLETSPTYPNIPQSKGVLVLNEGNFGKNDASMDYITFSPFGAQQGVYAANNDGAKLGDVANDVKIYGSKIYIVVNNSNKVEVLDAKTFKSLAKINVLLPRNLEMYNGKIYCTAWKIGFGSADVNRNGFVAVIDTTSLSVSHQIVVGRQPEGIAAANNKIYVANSGAIDGFGGKDFDSTVSVIDPIQNKEVAKISVDINLTSLKKGSNENIYVSSNGNADIPANLFKIDSKTDKVVKTYDIPVANFAIWKETLYYFAGFGTVEYGSIDLKTDVKKGQSYLPSDVQLESPYGIAIQPENGNILITDAPFTSLGKVIAVDQNQKKLWEQGAGYFPKSLIFMN